MKKLLSFVIPCYRSELTIEKVLAEIESTAAQRKESYDYEVICVNDGSPDNVLAVLQRAAAADKRVKVIDFSRNMGKHSALMAGFAYCSGDYIVTVDDDCQCPVYELWKLMEKVESGSCDYATAKYREKKQSAFKNFGSNINLAMSHILLGKPRNLRFENFAVMKRFVMDEIIKYDKPYPYMEGLVWRVTHSIEMVEMEERERGDGKPTGFTLGKSLSLWLNGFTAFSVKPLRVSTILGFLLAAGGFIVGLIMIIRKLINPAIAAGYTSLIAVQLFIGGMIMVILGLIGEYIGRIYICLNNTPQYIVRSTINIDKDKHAHENN